MVNIPAMAFFALATFLGNLAFSAMGLGMAIVYLFVYQVGSVAGLADCCNFKYAVFIQAIGLAVIQPLVLYSVGLRKYLKWELLIAFIPIQFVGTPLGIYLQGYTPVPVLKCGVGVLTIALSLWQIFNIYRARTKKRIDVENSIASEKPDVFFLIGSQRSGSNWLHLLINKKHPQIATPHPPHILKNFIPILDKFGDLAIMEKFDKLVGSVIEFVEANPVPWTDGKKTPIIFDHDDISKRCETQHTLMAIFEAIMNIYAEKNGCKTWMCKSMAVGVFHDQIIHHFGERAKYIYLARDPRDVCISFKKSPVGDSHLYVISENWTNLQQVALNIVNTLAQNVHMLTYEALLQNKEDQLDKLAPFLQGGQQEQGKQIIRQDCQSEPSHEEKLRAESSVLWKNLTRGDSFTRQQQKKWQKSADVKESDIKEIEAASFDLMQELGYKPVNDLRPRFTEKEIVEFKRMNEVGNCSKDIKLKEEDPLDWARREKQARVVQKLKDDENGFKGNILKNHLKSILFRPVIGWMLLAGFLSGFLGGLIGVRGPPLIVFFIFYDYPKTEVKANGALIASVNLVIRLFTYVFKSPPEEYMMSSWFIREDLWLYMAVAVAGLAACPIGWHLSKYLNHGGYKLALAILLILNGFTMITSAIIEIIQA